MAITLDGTAGITSPDLTDSSLTTGRVIYATTSGNLTSSANLLYTGTDLTVYGLTVGRGAGGVSSNTALGSGALSNASTTGGFNTSIGRNTLQTLTSGEENTAVGNSVLNLATTGSNNVGVGNASLAATTTGGSNSALGLGALQRNTTGSNSTAIGYQSLTYNTTSSNNTAVGYQAGYSNSTGAANTFIGRLAGYSATGTANTFVGQTAGYFSTGSYNTFVGTGSTNAAGDAVTTGSRNTIIGGYGGNQGGLDIRTASNYIVLSDGDGNPRGIFDNTGRFLIAQTSASAASAGGKFQIASDLLSTGSGSGYFWENRSGGVTSTSNWYGWYTTSGTIYLYNGGGNIASINATSGAYTALSDANKKKDFEDSSIGLSAVMQLKPKLFRMLDDSDDTPKQLGFVAQDVKDVIPQAYVEQSVLDAGNNNATYIGLNDRPIIAALTKAIQELKAEFDAYKATHP
jgi:hypothetical protein